MSSLSLLHALRSWVAGIIVSIVVMTAIGGGGNGKNAVYAQEENNFDNNPAYKKIAANAYSLSPPYLDTQMGSRWFDFGGDTIIRMDSYIRLASEHPSQRGWLFSRVPLAATNWQVELEFRMSGEGYLRGDGMAMWMTKERGQPGPVFGSVDKFEGLGIFFDTYKNGRPSTTFPYVMAMMGDGKTPYDADKDGKDNEIAGCSARGIRGTENPVKARVTYLQDQYLSVDLLYKPGDPWRKCFTVDAAQTNLKLPSNSYLGFTAATGDLTDNHDITSIKTFSLYPNAQHGAQRPLQSRPNSRSTVDESSSYGGSGRRGGGYVAKFLLLVVVICVCFYCFSLYNRSQIKRQFSSF